MPRNQRRLVPSGINRPGPKRTSPSSVSSISSLSRPNSPSAFSNISASSNSTPSCSRVSSPTGFGKREEQRSSRRSNSTKNRFVSFLNTSESPNSDGPRFVLRDHNDPPSPSELLPTMNWECATSTISNQNIQRMCDKPTYSRDTQYDLEGNPIEGSGRVISHGKVWTKIVTMTVTTTIASTEILHSSEPGYEESRRQQRTQETQRFSTELPELLAGSHLYESNTHDNLHRSHHVAAPMAPSFEDIPLSMVGSP